MNLLHYRIYRSFCSNFFLYYKKKNNDFSKYKKYLKKINTKNDLQNFKIDGILYGDLIYDSYLREKLKHTINLNDKDFIAKGNERACCFHPDDKNKTIKVSARANKPDSAEVIVDDEFIGVIFEDKEDGETCYHFNMTILEVDLDEEI